MGTKTLQNQVIKETFAKNRRSKALLVQEEIADGRTHRQTHRHGLTIHYIGTTKVGIKTPMARASGSTWEQTDSAQIFPI